jgi:hypothetical protein
VLQHFAPVMGLKQALEEAGSISVEESHAVASVHVAATAVGTPPSVPALSPSAKINSYSASVLQMQQLARGASGPGKELQLCSGIQFPLRPTSSDHLWVNICFSYTSLTTQCHGQFQHSVAMGLRCSTTPIVSYEGICFLQTTAATSPDVPTAATSHSPGVPLIPASASSSASSSTTTMISCASPPPPFHFGCPAVL